MFRRATLAAALLVGMASGTLAADTLNVDPVHSSVIFKISHFDTSNFYGRFGRVEGKIVADNQVPTALEVRVDADTIDTNNKDRDNHLRGPDFFDTKQFPDITFKSTSIKPVAGDEKSYEVAGELTLHGVTKPLTVTLNLIGHGKNVKGVDISGYESVFSIKRSEFGMSNFLNKGVGDEVTLTVSLEVTKG